MYESELDYYTLVYTIPGQGLSEEVKRQAHSFHTKIFIGTVGLEAVRPLLAATLRNSRVVEADGILNEIASAV